MHPRRIRTDVGDEERLVGEIVPWALPAGLFAVGDHLYETLCDLHAERFRDDPLLDDHHGRGLVELVQHGECVGICLRTRLRRGGGQTKHAAIISTRTYLFIASPIAGLPPESNPWQSRRQYSPISNAAANRPA
jgi:hypothetical protein